MEANDAARTASEFAAFARFDTKEMAAIKASAAIADDLEFQDAKERAEQFVSSERQAMLDAIDEVEAKANALYDNAYKSAAKSCRHEQADAIANDLASSLYQRVKELQKQFVDSEDDAQEQEVAEAPQVVATVEATPEHKPRTKLFGRKPAADQAAE